MADEEQLLELIEQSIQDHGGDLSGWTHRDDGTLKIFDGRVSLNANIDDASPEQPGVAHVHVYATLHDHDDEVLDACLFGMAEDRDGAIAQATIIWMTGVAGPIRSFIDNKPVCMTCQAGVVDGDRNAGFVSGTYGLSNVRGFVGPSFMRGFNDQESVQQIDDAAPWFRYAAESAAPRRVHLAKATILCNGKEGWHRDLEIDGHDVSHHDPNWPAGLEIEDQGYMTRFAVFEFPRNSTIIEERAELDRTIKHFIQHYTDFENIDDLMDDMERQGFHADLVHDVEAISTIAFGRYYFERSGVQYSSVIFRARASGEIERDVPLMEVPAFSRGKAILAQLHEELGDDKILDICLYNAESHAIIQALESSGNEAQQELLSGMTLYPCVVPDRGTSQKTMDLALAELTAMIERNRGTTPTTEKKPWWKFW